jgi:alpha-amylase
MINFEFKYDAQKRLWIYILKYSAILNGELKGNSVLNYLSSHDDGGPFDAKRTKLLKQVQNFYFLRNCSGILWWWKRPSLVVEGTQGDATLRSFMNWDAIKKILRQKHCRIGEN